jgi:demethoxyubiquinone hydroxylase (CLK1/Coq7/Cat5 family)
MMPSHLACRVAAFSSGSITRLVLGYGSVWRRFGNTSNQNCSINFSQSIQNFLAQAPSNPLAARAVSDLRSDHAGEWGAVKIYEGMEWAANVRLSYDTDALALLRLIDFTKRHKESECRHLIVMSHMLPAQHRTRLLPLWTAAGFLLGAVSESAPQPWRACCCICVLICCVQIPVFFGGPTAAYRTVVHVETFVEQHYNEQGLHLEIVSSLEFLSTAAVYWMSREAAALCNSDIASPLGDVMRVLSACCSDEVHHMHEASASASAWPSAAGAVARRLQVVQEDVVD